jgi:hypothetical protein
LKGGRAGPLSFFDLLFIFPWRQTQQPSCQPIHFVFDLPLKIAPFIQVSFPGANGIAAFKTIKMAEL